MKASKTSNNEDEKVSFWDYIDKLTLLRVVLFLTIIICVIVVVYLHFQGLPDKDAIEPIEPHLHP